MKRLIIVIFIFLLFVVVSCSGEKTYQGVVMDKMITGFHSDESVLIVKTQNGWIRIRSQEIYYNCEINDEIMFTIGGKGATIGSLAYGNGHYQKFITTWRKL